MYVGEHKPRKYFNLTLNFIIIIMFFLPEKSNSKIRIRTRTSFESTFEIRSWKIHDKFSEIFRKSNRIGLSTENVFFLILIYLIWFFFFWLCICIIRKYLNLFNIFIRFFFFFDFFYRQISHNWPRENFQFCASSLTTENRRGVVVHFDRTPRGRRISKGVTVRAAGRRMCVMTAGISRDKTRPHTVHTFKISYTFVRG